MFSHLNSRSHVGHSLRRNPSESKGSDIITAFSSSLTLTFKVQAEITRNLHVQTLEMVDMIHGQGGALGPPSGDQDQTLIQDQL